MAVFWVSPTGSTPPRSRVCSQSLVNTGVGSIIRSATRGSSHIQPKTSVKDFDLTLIQWETRLDALLLPR